MGGCRRHFFKRDSGAIMSRITLLSETALHVVVGKGNNLDFVEKLVELMCEQSLPLKLKDSYGNTALAVAPIVGNVKAAKILVGKNKELPLVKNKVNYSPLLLAAKYGHRDMILYLLSVTKDEGVFTGKAGARLLNLLIAFDLYDVALDILNRLPELAVEQDQYGVSALQTLAEKPNVFESGSQLGFLQRLLHRCLVVEVCDAPQPNQHRDVENLTQISKNAESRGAFYQLLTFIHTAGFRKLVTAPSIKNVYDTKRMHVEAHMLVRCLCEEALNKGEKGCAGLFSTSLFSAARMGILEVATEILRVYPYAIWFRELAPSDRISGVALQLQRELQWLKEVERLVQPSNRSMKNKDGKTPRMVFSERHKGLVHQGEKWMKITASSCTVVAALIATVAFTAVFTVPGGNNSDQGIPILIQNKSFLAFAATDALALISSSVSVMMFLEILTSRYAEDDFLKALPTRLIIGLVSLFISISSMMAAFGASLYLVLVHQVKWVWIPLILFAFIPVILFAMSQFPLLVQMISFTYGCSIFGLQK
ncbi:unnamed protein product [Citrullus colocynthis]|uniref:PGG domain-containing protein n=1 Tax=Citrullus colocynthis TaxID=252529 RepID=A0ABP0YCK5_9ROSI